MRDPETGNSKGFAFINFASFDASDAAMEAMNGQYLCNRPITISYAFKKESKGERHGSAAGIDWMLTIKILCTSLHDNLIQCIIKLHLFYLSEMQTFKNNSVILLSGNYFFETFLPLSLSRGTYHEILL